jgi:membrane associated rhomboid family serine protease
MIYDRPYMRDAQPVSSSVIKILLVANVAVFAFQIILGRHFPTDIFALKSESWLLKPWTLVTYSFLHSTREVFPWHLVVNMLGLFFIGRALEQTLTNRQIATLYFGCVIGGAILAVAANFGKDATIIGASAGMLGLLIYFCLTRPNERITFLLFFIIPVTMKPKWLGWIVFLIDFYMFFSGELTGQSDRAHSAHLGGMLGAVLFYRFAMGNRFSFSNFGNLATPFGKPPSSPNGRRRPVQPTNYTVNTQASRDHLQKEVDRILDKINEHGFGSLTQQEKQTLDQAKDVLKR